MKTLITVIFSLSTVLAYNISLAQEAWVTDELKITLRSGESTRHKILRELFAGASIEVIQDNPETGFSLVKTDDGFEGYVMSRFVSKEMPAKAQVTALKKRLTQLETGDKKTEMGSLYKDIDELNQEIIRLTQENANLQSDLDRITEVSGDALKLNDQHLAVLESNKLLESELSIYKAENLRLENSEKRETYINAIAAILLGIVIAIVVPRIARNRGRSEWG